MKTLSEIYESIKAKFYSKTNLDIQPGTVVDFYMLASSEAIKEAYDEIEANKTPYIFTGQSGDDLDSTGYMVNLSRMANETDENYKYRLMNWLLSMESGNVTAIEAALMNMTYASFVTYVPYTNGVGTATAYIIPKNYTDDMIANAIDETRQKLRKVTSPAAYIDYIIPSTVGIKIAASITTKSGDLDLIKNTIKTKIANYINAIPVGNYLSIGDINKIGINEANVDYFSAVQIYMNGEPISALSVLQKVESKFLFDEIIWWTAVI